MAEKPNPYYMPPPRDTGNPGATIPKRPPTAAERVKEAYVQGAEARATAEGLGVHPTNEGGDKGGGAIPASQLGQIMGSTVAQYMKSYAEGLTSLMTEVIKSKGGEGASSEKNQFLTYLIGEMKDMKAKLEGGGGDPLEVIDSYHAKMTKWQEETRQQFGLPALGNAAAGVPNIEVLKLTLEQEDRKTERERMRIQADKEFQVSGQRHEEYMAELKHRWAKDDQKWEAEFNLRLAELKQENAGKDETRQQFQDLAGQFIGSLQVTPAGASGAQAAGANKSTPPDPAQDEFVFPVSMTCTNKDPECNQAFAWPKGQMTANCPKCGTEYTLQAKK